MERLGEQIWFNGTLRPWRDCTVHVMAHVVHYGSSVFEGLRAYKTPRGVALFQLTNHIQRLFDSAKIYRLDIPYTQETLRDACKEVVRHSGIEAPYLRPIVYRGFGKLGVLPSRDTPVEVAIAALDWGAYMGEGALERGVHAGVSSWSRVAANTIPAMAKASGNYLSSQLIALEAERLGYGQAIALDVHGHVSEGPSANIFLVKKGVLYTPPLTAAILDGITRQTIITLAQGLGLQVRQEDLCRESLYVADEMFFTGSAAEISPICSVDGIAVGAGKRGPITRQLQEAFYGLFSGSTPDPQGWLELV